MSTIPKSLRSGLVGEWLFAGNAKDTSGNGNDGTVNGASLTTDMLGRADRAYDFDGSNDYIEIENTFASDFGIDGNSSKTILAWIKPHAFDGGTIWSIGSASNTKEFTLSIESGEGNWKAQLHGIDEYFSAGGLNEWMCIAFVYDGSTFYIYNNGLLIESYSKTFDTGNNNPFRIGAGRNAGQFFNGQIALPKIWNRALTQTEIQQLYIRGIGTGI